MNPHAPLHGTFNEIEFIDGLGTFSSLDRPLSRHKLLVKYRDAMALRVRWGKIDKDAVKFHVEQSLVMLNDAFAAMH
jgi:hypothetical protein